MGPQNFWGTDDDCLDIPGVRVEFCILDRNGQNSGFLSLENNHRLSRSISIVSVINDCWMSNRGKCFKQFAEALFAQARPSRKNGSSYGASSAVDVRYFTLEWFTQSAQKSSDHCFLCPQTERIKVSPLIEGIHLFHSFEPRNYDVGDRRS